MKWTYEIDEAAGELRLQLEDGTIITVTAPPDFGLNPLFHVEWEGTPPLRGPFAV